MTSGTIVFDLTSAARWSGPPVGIVRAQRELARWARDHLPNLVFAAFDPATMGYRALSARHADAFIAGTASLNAWASPDPTGRRRRRSAWLPGRLYDALQARRTVLRLLERIRLAERRPRLSRLADRLQRALITPRHRGPMINDDGSRRDFLPPDMVFGQALRLEADDTLICAGFGWSHSNITAIAQAKARFGFRLGVLCYDVIPLVRPELYKPRDVDDMRRYWSQAIAAADVIVVNADAVAADVRAFAQEIAIAVPRIVVRPLGASSTEMRSSPAESLPEGLEPDRYALFVSTIEPRKGHEMLYRLWLRLLEAGVPQASRFKLVFVGRSGWMTEALETQLRNDRRLAGSLMVLDRVSDGRLDLLYRRAAFCLYPSLIEGYGLPVVEAFARGKPVLVSVGGALAEVAGEFSPVLPARDEAAWFAMLRAWIEDPAARRPYEAAIRERFRHPSWDEAAAAILAALTAPQPAAAA